MENKKITIKQETLSKPGQRETSSPWLPSGLSENR